MILRDLERKLVNALANRPVVALVGPRQSGKTTLALQIAQKIKSKKSSYLDLKLDSDLSKLEDMEGYLRRFAGQLLIIDEVQRKPDLFQTSMRCWVTLLREQAGKDMLQRIPSSTYPINGNTVITERQRKQKLISYWRDRVRKSGQLKSSDQLRPLSEGGFMLPARISVPHINLWFMPEPNAFLCQITQRLLVSSNS